jgi:hypothetical protein
MTHRTRAVLIAIALALSGVADISAETVQANIGGQPKVWGYVANDSTATRIVAMWQKKNSDIDLMIYGDQPPPNGILVGVGLSTVERLEIVEVGAGLHGDTKRAFSAGTILSRNARVLSPRPGAKEGYSLNPADPRL